MGDSSLLVIDGIIKKLLNVQDKPTQTEVTDITTDEVMLLCRKIRTVRLLQQLLAFCACFALRPIHSYAFAIPMRDDG